MFRRPAVVFAALLLVAAANPAGAKLPGKMRTITFKRPTIARLAVRQTGVGVREGYYRVHDVGNPTIGHPGFTEASIVNFNNTGQIVGTVREPRGTDSIIACTVYTAGRFVDVPAQTASHDCQPQSMSDANAKTGTFSIVGYRDWPFAYYAFGFVANVSPHATTIDDFVDDEALFTNVNDTGAVAGFATAEGPDNLAGVVTTTTSHDLHLLEPACPVGCFLPAFATPGLSEPSEFHSGSLNDSGIVVGYDPYGSLDVFTLGQPASTRPLGVTPLGGAEINNANQVAYPNLQSISPFHYRVFVDTLATGKIVEVPPIPGSTCTDYFKIDLTDFGGIFGVASGCSSSSGTSDQYFLYDPQRGTRAFAPVLVDSTPLVDFGFGAENDNGQILFTALNSVTGQWDWGTLDPVTSLPSPRR